MFFEKKSDDCNLKTREKVHGFFRAVKVPEMDVSDHDLSESFGKFKKSLLVAEIIILLSALNIGKSLIFQHFRGFGDC